MAKPKLKPQPPAAAKPSPLFKAISRRKIVACEQHWDSDRSLGALAFLLSQHKHLSAQRLSNLLDAVAEGLNKHVEEGTDLAAAITGLPAVKRGRHAKAITERRKAREVDAAYCLVVAVELAGWTGEERFRVAGRGVDATECRGRIVGLPTLYECAPGTPRVNYLRGVYYRRRDRGPIQGNPFFFRHCLDIPDGPNPAVEIAYDEKAGCVVMRDRWPLEKLRSIYGPQYERMELFLNKPYLRTP